jgi:hypothetical protein
MAGAGIGSSGPENLCNTTICRRFDRAADIIGNLLVQSGHPSGHGPAANPVAKSTQSAMTLGLPGSMEQIRCQPLRPT